MPPHAAHRLPTWLLFWVCLLTLAACTRYERDPPRDFAWPPLDLSTANVQHEVLDDGRLHLRIEHVPLPGITPEMLRWWYEVLPVSEVVVAGKTYPFYHLFHLTEHGRVWLEAPASDGRAGAGPGAVMARFEWFGEYDSLAKGRITELSANGMVGHPEFFGLALGEFRHVFEPGPRGARYRIDHQIGVTWPVVGPAVNRLLRVTTFSEGMLAEWKRHQIEEVANLQHFLPQLYAQRAQAPRYTLTFQ